MNDAIFYAPIQSWQPAEFPSATRAISANSAQKLEIDKSAAWWRDIIDTRLTELCRLPTGWDGHTGKPVKGGVASFTLAVLSAIMRPGVPRPSIVPLSSGGLQVEWHCRGWDIEVAIYEPGDYQAWSRNVTTDDEEETPVTRDLGYLASYVKRISDPYRHEIGS